MIDKLKQKYGDDLVINQTVNHQQDFFWYTTPANQLIGIKRAVLTKNEQALLNIFLTPFSLNQTNQCSEERFWEHYLFDHQPLEEIRSLLPNVYPSLRFIHFKCSNIITDQESFQEAILNFFYNDTTILWETLNNGIIIEKLTNPSDESPIYFEEVIDAVTSDFLIDISIFIGIKSPLLHQAKEQHDWEKQAFSASLNVAPKQKVFIAEEAVPYMLLEQAESALLDTITKKVLAYVKDDKDLIRTIKIYLECNLNTTLAAKRLFMHRNSLQYRVDKFIEKTGIDIKQFQQAVTVYLAIMIYHSPR